jgi:hypothetical protein
MASPVAILAGFGQTVDDDFAQGQRRVAAGILPGQVDGGFCNGVCLDWMRRVVQGGHSWYDPARTARQQPLSQAQINERKIAQTMRMGTIHMRTGGDTPPVSTPEQRLYAARGVLIDLYNANLQAEELQVPAALVRQIKEFATFDDEPNHIYSTAFLGQLIDLLNGPRAPSGQTSWRAVAVGMDTYFNNARRGAGRNDTSRPFTGITVASHTGMTIYPGLGAATNAIFAANGFNIDTGIIAGFEILIPQPNAPARVSGHSVALFRRANNSYDFFDPNFGVYRYNQGGVTQAINYLFGTRYQQNGDRVLHANGNCRMDTNVFTRAQ